jgi:hypothetical protein
LGNDPGNDSFNCGVETQAISLVLNHTRNHVGEEIELGVATVQKVP